MGASVCKTLRSIGTGTGSGVSQFWHRRCKSLDHRGLVSGLVTQSQPTDPREIILSTVIGDSIFCWPKSRRLKKLSVCFVPIVDIVTSSLENKFLYFLDVGINPILISIGHK